MTKKRWMKMMEDDSMELTAEEIGAGWHFCPEWDGLLIFPGMPEAEACTCRYPADTNAPSPDASRVDADGKAIELSPPPMP